MTSGPTNVFSELSHSEEVIFGAKTATHSPQLIEVYGEVGLDFAMVDFEHAGSSIEDVFNLEDLVRSARLAAVQLLVKLPRADPTLLGPVLDTGIRNVIVPQVESADQVRRLVEAGKFAYEGGPGSRGIGSSRRNRWGKEMNESFAKAEDDTTCIGVIIENRRALEDLESILEIPQLGFVIIGTADLSISLGHPLETDHPTVVDSYDDIVQQCVASDVPYGVGVPDPAAARRRMEEGCQIVQFPGEI